MKLLQIFEQTFICVVRENKLSTKNGVATKFMANFACVPEERQTFYQKWSCSIV